MITTNYIRLWHCCREQYTALPVALIFMLALFASSCGSKQKIVGQQWQTEVSQRHIAHATQILTNQSVTADTVHLNLTEENLRKLPATASYTAQSGRAKVSVTRKDTTLVISATCDSLQRLVEYYQERADSLYSASYRQQLQVKEQTGSTLTNSLVLVATGIIAGIVLVICLYRLK